MPRPPLTSPFPSFSAAVAVTRHIETGRRAVWSLRRLAVASDLKNSDRRALTDAAREPGSGMLATDSILEEIENDLFPESLAVHLSSVAHGTSGSASMASHVNAGTPLKPHDGSTSKGSRHDPLVSALGLGMTASSTGSLQSPESQFSVGGSLSVGGEPPELSGVAPAGGSGGFGGFGNAMEAERQGDDPAVDAANLTGMTEDLHALSAASEFELQCSWFEVDDLMVTALHALPAAIPQLSLTRLHHNVVRHHNV